MRKYAKLVLVAFTAGCVLASAVATASARRIEVSNQSFRVVWNPLRFTPNTLGTERPEVRCPVTIEGSFHSRTLSKVSGQLVGYITRAILPNPRTPCSFNNGAEAVEILTTTLPWHILYISFSGTLPRITRIRLSLRGTSFSIRVAGVNCLYRATEASPAFGEVLVNAAEEATQLRADETVAIPRIENIFCPAQGFFEGTGEVTVQGGTTRIRVRLVQ